MSISLERYASLPDDASMIQAAADAGCQCGETVVIPRKNPRTGEDIYILNRAVCLSSNSVICLENCHLRLADGCFDNMFKTVYARTAQAGLPENRIYDIHLYGIGMPVLDGGNHNGLVERNSREIGLPALVNTMIHFQNAERIIIEGLRIVNARYWGMTFHFCSDARISNIRFMSNGFCPNNDGIDLRLGCHDFIIENITGYTQDDTIALTALDDSIAHVEGMDDSIHGIQIRNVSACSRCAIIRLLNHFRRKLYNVCIENVQTSVETDPANPFRGNYALRLPDSGETTPARPDVYWADFSNGQRQAEACIRIGENHYSVPECRASLGDTFNIIVRNVQADCRYGIVLSRTLCDSVFENIQMYGNALSAVRIREGDYDNLRFQSLNFARTCHRNPALPINDAAVVLEDCRARHLVFNGIVTHPEGQKAFSGAIDGIEARDVLERSPS